MHTFRYRGLRFDWEHGCAEFDFAHEGTRQEQTFTETVTFPLPRDPLLQSDRERFHRVLDLLYVAVGTAYYKTVAPGQVSVDAVALSPAAARWATRLYRDGLTEFAYRWSLDHVLDLPVHTRRRDPAPVQHDVSSSPQPPLVGFSGGKDSIVAVEVLKSAGFTPATFTTVRRPKPQLDEAVAATGVRSLQVHPAPDPQLDRMLRQKVLRVGGPAPLTAITSLVGAAVAALHGFGPVVLANERSADEPNMTWRGRGVNHQWAKSTAAEHALDEALAEHAGVASGCFSLLRGLSEVEICRLFAATDGYDSLVTSCNVIARSSGIDGRDRWCRSCAKCQWVFMALALSMSRSRLVAIFGCDLLDDPAQIQGYRQLMGVTGHKPFECVGEVLEARAALALLTDHPDWRHARVVRELQREVPAVPSGALSRLWQVEEAPLLPTVYRKALAHWSAAAVPVSHGGL